MSTWKFIKRSLPGIIVGILLIAMLCLAIVAGSAQDERVRLAYAPYHGMTETGYNRGPFIDSCNSWARVPLRSPYCASCGGYVLVERLNASHPGMPSIPARSRAWITDDAVSAVKVWRNATEIPVPSVGIWTRRGGGHWSVVWKVTGDSVFTFEFNTSPDRRGSQWNGRWSGFKVRNVSRDCAPTNPYRFTHFVPIELPEFDSRGGGMGWFFEGLPLAVVDGVVHQWEVVYNAVYATPLGAASHLRRPSFSFGTPLKGLLSDLTSMNWPVLVLRLTGLPEPVFVCDRSRTDPLREPLPVFVAIWPHLLSSRGFGSPFKELCLQQRPQDDECQWDVPSVDKKRGLRGQLV